MTPPVDDESPMKIEEFVEESMPTGDININCVRKIVAKTKCKGEAWYLVDKKWYEQFEKFVTDKEPTHNPGPIDNSKLFNSSANGSFELRDQLEEELDYKCVPEEAWQMLYGYFGIQNDRHTIKRWVIEVGHNFSFCIVEIYLIDLKLCSYERPDNFVTSSYSRMTTLHDLEGDMKRLFKVDSSRESKIYHRIFLNTLLNTDDGKTLDDVSITHGDTVVLEVRSKNGTWPSSVTETDSTSMAAAEINSAREKGSNLRQKNLLPQNATGQNKCMYRTKSPSKKELEVLGHPPNRIPPMGCCYLYCKPLSRKRNLWAIMETVEGSVVLQNMSQQSRYTYTCTSSLKGKCNGRIYTRDIIEESTWILAETKTGHSCETQLEDYSVFFDNNLTVIEDDILNDTVVLSSIRDLTMQK